MANFVYVAVLIKYIWEQNQLLTHLGAVAMGILSQRMHELVIFYKAGTHVPPHTCKHRPSCLHQIKALRIESLCSKRCSKWLIWILSIMGVREKRVDYSGKASPQGWNPHWTLKETRGQSKYKK